MSGAKEFPVHPEILASSVLSHLFDLNARRNLERFGRGATGTWLLPSIFTEVPCNTSIFFSVLKLYV